MMNHVASLLRRPKEPLLPAPPPHPGPPGEQPEVKP